MQKEECDILILDDEKIIIDSIAKIVRLLGYSADFSESSFEALSKVKKKSYTLIISDIMMPVMNGFEFLQELKNINCKAPVIMTTGYSTVDNAVKSLKSGAVSFLSKPFTVEELTGAVKQGIKLSHIINNNEKEKILVVSCPAKYYRLGINTWINRKDSEIVKIGLCDLFIKSLDKISGITLLEQNEDIIQGNCCGHVVSSEDCQHSILAPLSGRIVNVNSKLISNPLVIEKDPYFEGWLYEIIPSNPDAEIEGLFACSSDSDYKSKIEM